MNLLTLPPGDPALNDPEVRAWLAKASAVIEQGLKEQALFNIAKLRETMPKLADAMEAHL